MVSFGCADTSSSEEDAFRRILARHTVRHPELEAQDLYKLVYQAALGSEHAVAGVSQARVWLEQESEHLIEGPGEPVIEPISPDGQIVRVHLRPYVAQGGDLEVLLEAFARTAQEYQGTILQLRRYWRYAEQLAKEGALGLAVDELSNLFAELEGRGFPALHHSKAYREAYRPAYRVVMRDYLVQIRTGRQGSGSPP